MIQPWILSPIPSASTRRPVRTGRLAARVIRLGAWLSIILLGIGVGNVCRAQAVGAYVDPKLYGVDLPPGPVQSGNGRTVTTMNGDGMLVTGRLHVQIGDGAVVMLPDGQLVIRNQHEFTFTDRKFQPIARDELAKRLVSSEFKGFSVKQTRHYVYVYKSSEAFWLGTSGILESMLTGVMKEAKGYGISVHEPDIPLVVVLFANEAEFQKYRRMPLGVTAYYHPLSNRVFLHEPRELGELSRELAVSQAISTVAHEGAHQILQNIGVQQRLSAWPMWISEGMAEYFAPTSFGKNLTWKGAGRINDLRMFELQRYLQGRAGIVPDGRMIEQTVAAARLSSAGYASAWAVIHFLAKNEKNQFKNYLREVSQLGPLEGHVPAKGEPALLAHLEPFRKHFGEDLAELEARLIAYLNKQPIKDPFAELPHFLVQLVIRGDDKGVRLQGDVFYSSVLAENWARDEIAKLAPELQPGAYKNIIPFRNRAEADAFKTRWLQKKGG